MPESVGKGSAQTLRLDCGGKTEKANPRKRHPESHKATSYEEQKSH